jgi:hypothetical protein
MKYKHQFPQKLLNKYFNIQFVKLKFDTIFILINKIVIEPYINIYFYNDFIKLS